MKRLGIIALALLLYGFVLLRVMPAEAGAEEITSGTFGKNLTWSLDEQGTLTISGEGEIPAYSFDDEDWCPTPWYEVKDRICSVVIQSGVTNVGMSAFEDCDNIQSIALADTVRKIDDYAFCGCWGLKSIRIPDHVTSIGYFSFELCSYLETVILGDGIQFIDARAFQYCENLKTVVIGSGIQTIESYAFYGCKDLKKIYFTGDAPDIGYFGDSVKATIYYPKGNDTWTKEIMRDYGGDITWKATSYKLKKPVVQASNVASSGKIKLQWEEINIADEYQIYRADSKSGKYEMIAATTKTSYTDKNAIPGEKYDYKVRAISLVAGKSGYSKVVSRTCDLAKPEVEESNVSSSGKIKLEWKKIEGAIKYKIYRRVGKTGDYEYYKSTTKTSYTDKAAKAGTVYYYKVVAVHENSSANSAKSSGVGQTCDLARPNVKVKLSKGDPKLSWEKVSSAKEYKIYRAISKDGKYKAIKTTINTSYTDKAVKAGKTYYYKVKAIHKTSSANSAYSSVDKIKTK